MTDTMRPRPATPLTQFLPNSLDVLEAPPRLIELLPIAIYACSRDGRILWFNQKAVELWGRAPRIGDETELYCGSFKLNFEGRDIGRGETPMAEVLRTGSAIHGAEAMLQRPDGSRVWAMVHIDPVFDSDGNVAGAINCFHDTTAAHAANAALQQHQQDLRERDQRLAATYEHAAIGISEVDAEGIRLRVNEAACAILGYSRYHLTRTRVFDLIHPDDHDDDFRQHCKLVAGEIERYTLEKRFLRADGRFIWLAVTCTAVRDEAGKFQYAVRVFQDVTETRHAIGALAESEQRLAATYQHAAIGISEVDANGRLLRVNDTVCAIIGYSAEELLKLTVFDVTHPDDRTGDVESYRRQVGEDAGRYAIEKRLVCKDGRVIWVSVTSSSVHDAAGRFLYGIRVMQDITARKHAEEMLRENEQRLRQLLEALPAAVYTTDARGRVTFYNQAAVELSGREPQLDSDEWCITWRLFHPDGTPMPHHECPMAIALKENRPVRGCEAVAERPDGTRVPFIPYPTPLRDIRGTPIGAVNMLVDITERKRAEDRQKVLIDELNHRVKNTLATVQSLAAQTLRGTGQAGDIFLSRLFALSRTHDQLSRTGWEAADFKSIVEGIFAPYQAEDSARLRLSGESVSLPPQSALLLAMVIHELATNAAKYGSLSVPEGVLDLTWTATAEASDRRMVIDWRESGGPRVRKPRRQGFGSRLAERAISQELKGEAQISFDPDGVRCRFAFPLSPAIEPQ